MGIPREDLLRRQAREALREQIGTRTVREPKLVEGATIEPAAHADTHEGGSDPITPAGIGASQKGHSHPPKHNLAATAAPGASNDETAGYGVGSIWIDIVASPRKVYVCVDATAGAAVWLDIGPGAAGAHGPASHTEFAAWKLIHTDANGDQQEIGLGTDGQVLTSTGAASAPAMENLPAAGPHGPEAHTEFGTWKLIHTDGSGDQQEIALGAAGTFLRSAGAAAAPTCSAIQAADLPDPITADTINEKTPGNGSLVEGVLLKDGLVQLRYSGAVAAILKAYGTNVHARNAADSAYVPIRALAGLFEDYIHAGKYLYLTGTEPSELTISGGAITQTSSWHKLQPQSGTSDDLDTITAVAGGSALLFLQVSDAADTITIKHNTGNIICSGGADIALSGDQDLAILMYNAIGAKWYCLADRVTGLAVQDLGSGAATDGQVFKADGAGGVVVEDDFETINFIIDGGGEAITTGIKGDVQVDFACTIMAWSILPDQSGSIVIDIWKDSYANFPPTNADAMPGAGKEPTLSATTKAQDTDVTDWATDDIAAGDILRFNVDSVATVERVTLALKVKRT
ncbi:hypothetical protein AMK68_00185 [candidate division KD3-62 bacterium DG_56]|uniref:Uncharacterized protein n=1 Tax=candidate division KD3-62 bacterium DG_56 TaxID=1704032 RepID=A0A0S7XR83_9BACT|nr:MAG: hypothetical protein AMK68_00185 [candidate division KD3-62 bacterium DG_56]